MLFDCFLRSYVPRDELGPSEDDDWFGALAMLPNQPPCLTAAMLAMSLSQVGKANSDEHISKESLRHYTMGLRELQKALYDPRQMHTDETLAACFILSFYELLECPDGDKRAYAQHNKACAKLIQLRGPKGYKKGLAHSLFVAIRPQIVKHFPSPCVTYAHHSPTTIHLRPDPPQIRQPPLQPPHHLPSPLQLPLRKRILLDRRQHDRHRRGDTSWPHI